MINLNESRKMKDYEERFFTIEETIGNLIKSIENLPDVKEKLRVFTESFEYNFPSDNSPNRSIAQVITQVFIDGPLLLYALGRNDSVITDLYANLELFALQTVMDPLDKLLDSALIERYESRIFRHCDLKDFSLFLKDVDVFDKDDLDFIEELKGLRDGIAHRNPRSISNRFFSGKNIPSFELDDLMKDVDIMKYIIGTIHLMIRMTSRNI